MGDDSKGMLRSSLGRVLPTARLMAPKTVENGSRLKFRRGDFLITLSSTKGNTEQMTSLHDRL